MKMKIKFISPKDAALIGLILQEDRVNRKRLRKRLSYQGLDVLREISTNT